MFRTRLVSLLALLALLAMPLAVFAQDGGDDEMEMAEYTSPDGLLTLSYPAEWVAQESDFLYGVDLANSQEALDAMADPESEGPTADMAFINVTLVTFDQFNEFGMGMEEGMTAEEMLGAFAEFVSGPPIAPEEVTEGTAEAPADDAAATEEAAADAEAAATEEAGQVEGTAEVPMAEVGEIQTVDFEDGRQAAWVTITSDFSDDVYILFPVNEEEGIFAVVDVYVAPGGLTDELTELGVAVAQSIQFSGTADDLAMPEVEVEPSDVDPASLDGNALVDERCTTCHDRERIDSQDKDEEGWTATVDRMISYGAQLNEAERQAVIDYLVETH